jgi:hypothetical protein
MDLGLWDGFLFALDGELKTNELRFMSTQSSKTSQKNLRNKRGYLMNFQRFGCVYLDEHGASDGWAVRPTHPSQVSRNEVLSESHF